MNKLPSPSSHDRVWACAASEVFPHSHVIDAPEADKGISKHTFFFDVPRLGREAALELVPIEYRSTFEEIDLSILPASEPDAYAFEVSFAFNVDTGESREIGRGLSRSEAAALCGPREMHGTVDVVGLTEDSVIVPDYKTGPRPLPPPAELRQLRVYGLMAARAYKKGRAKAGFIRVPDGMDPWSKYFEMDEFSLANTELEINEMLAKVEEARAVLASGRVPTTTEGDHCRYCPALASCPSKMNLVRQFAASPESLEAMLTKATDAQLALAYERANSLEKIIERVKEAIRSKARQMPIDMGDGQVLGEVHEDVLIIDRSMGVLAEKFGMRVAEAATERDPKISKASVERALKEYVLQPGMKITHLVKGVINDLREAGAIAKVAKVKKHKPKLELPAKGEAA